MIGVSSVHPSQKIIMMKRLGAFSKKTLQLEWMATYLGGADLVECDKNERLDKAYKFYIPSISERDNNHQYHLRQEQSQRHCTWDNLRQIQHVKIW